MNKYKKIRVSVLGCGRMGMRHAEVYARHPKVQIKGFYDSEVTIAKKLAQTYGSKIYDNAFSAIEDPDVDAISICTPNALHFELLKKSISVGKDVLVEKPIVTTIEHCNSIMKLMKKANMRIMVGHTHRFYSCNLALKSILDSGIIGRPKIINTFDYIPGKNPGQKMPSWIKQKNISGGGVFMTDLVHTVDKISWLLNSRIEKVYTTTISEFIAKKGIEDAGVAVLWFRNGAVATCVHGCPSPGAADMSIKVMGTSGEASLEFGKDLKIYKKIVRNIMYKHRGNLPEHNKMGFFNEINEFINSILDNKQPKVTYKDGILAVTTILALYRSFKANIPITL
ncbi:MAG: Gfo/Idh/MocA family protein [Nitrososphaeraceae archaeon]